MIPVIGGGKSDDRDSECRDAEIGKRTHVAAIVHGEIFAEYPAAISCPNNVAPGFITQASPYVDRIAVGNDADAWVVRIGACPQINICGGVARCCLRVWNSQGH